MKRKLSKAMVELGLAPQRWRRFPQVIQIDTNNHCGLRYCGILCRYCYPQWKIANRERGYAEMSMDAVELIIRQAAKYGSKELDFIDFFLNGDGFTEPRLPEMHRYAKRWLPEIYTQTFTNGIRWENYEAALSLDRVAFTISAHTPELYRKIHRGDHFGDALKGLELVLDNRKPSQKVEVHMVLCEDNVPYAREWWEFFGSEYPDATRIISPLVASYDNKPSQQSLGAYTLDELEKTVIEVAGEDGRMWTREMIPDQKPCVLWDNCSIDVEGAFLQCCNWSPPRDVNYGNVYTMEAEGLTLKDMWMLRLKNHMNNRLCQSCNMKHRNWVNRF